MRRSAMAEKKPIKVKLKMPYYTRVYRKMWRETARLLYKKHSQYAVPTTLGICLTGLCNIRCPYCMRETFQPKGVMTLEKVKQIMHSAPYISGVCIMGLCEPFMNPEAPNVVRYLREESGRKVALTTNGMVPLTDDRIDCLLRVDDFVISIDTNDPETFRYLRGGADLTRVMDSLHRVIEFKHQRGLGRYDNPPIHINAVITSKNFDQIPGLIEMLEPYAKDLTYLMVDPVSRPDYSKFDPLALTDKPEFEESIRKYRKMAKESPLQIVGLDYMLQPSHAWKNCGLAWLTAWVEPNGDVYLCYDYANALGNVFSTSLLKAWNSPQARIFRKKLCTNNPPLQQCRVCNFAREGWQSGGRYYYDPKDQE
jgi:radical SAM protein with 4Fe4S-binding SPASM domain